MQPLIFGNSAFKPFQYFYVTLIIQPEFEELTMLPKDLHDILSTNKYPKKLSLPDPSSTPNLKFKSVLSRLLTHR